MKSAAAPIQWHGVPKGFLLSPHQREILYLPLPPPRPIKVGDSTRILHFIFNYDVTECNLVWDNVFEQIVFSFYSFYPFFCLLATPFSFSYFLSLSLSGIFNIVYCFSM